jgi:DNA-binding IscR family transcriptional regulator
MLEVRDAMLATLEQKTLADIIQVEL